MSRAGKGKPTEKQKSSRTNDRTKAFCSEVFKFALEVLAAVVTAYIVKLLGLN